MKKLPLVIGAVVVIGGVVFGVRFLKQRSANQIEEMRYPIAATQMQKDHLQVEAAKWKRGRDALLAALVAFEPSEPPASDKPCPLSLALPREDAGITDGERMASARDRDPEENIKLAFETSPELADKVDQQLTTLLATAGRARFHSVRGRQLAIAAVVLPLVVMKLEEKQSPTVTMRSDMYGTRKVFSPGRRAGVAYVFDKQTGKLRCAGRFEAMSSESIETVQGEWGAGNENDVIEIDFETNTIKAIESAVRAIE
jgi:hypothetical protein